MNPELILNDTVKAVIVPVDLVSIIETNKREQAEEYGGSEGYALSEYQKALANLKKGSYIQRLQDDRLARDIVRAIMQFDKPVSFRGNDSAINFRTSVIFQSYSDDVVGQKISDLRGDGLLDFTFYGCGSPNVYCFQTELIYWREEKRRIGKEPTFDDWQKYSHDPKIREAVSRMLDPFKTEKPLYTLPVPVERKATLL